MRELPKKGQLEYLPAPGEAHFGKVREPQSAGDGFHRARMRIGQVDRADSRP
jgi:hypothetical protein